MKLFSAIGLVLLIIALKILMTEVFSGLEETLLRFFELTQAVLVKSQSWLSSAPSW